MTEWVRVYEEYEGAGWLEHIDGVDWYDAQIPPLAHQCVPQTRALLDGVYVERCACSAIKTGRDGGWAEVNGRSGLGRTYVPLDPQLKN